MIFIDTYASNIIQIGAHIPIHCYNAGNALFVDLQLGPNSAYFTSTSIKNKDIDTQYNPKDRCIWLVALIFCSTEFT